MANSQPLRIKWDRKIKLSRFPQGNSDCQSKTPQLFVSFKETEHTPMLQEIFFVNNSEETLETVESSCGGMITIDDDVAPVTGAEYVYHDVEPDEAVKVESYHEVYDPDFLLQLKITIKTSSNGLISWSKIYKNKFPCEVILWDDGSFGKNVQR